MAFLTIPGANMCDFEVAIAFGSSPNSSSPSWTDVTPYVRSINITRGQTRELDTWQTGTMTVVLNNSDRRFDPTYASSPYNGNLVPLVPIRLRCQYPSGSGTIYDRFYGMVTGWPQSYDLGNIYAESSIQCVDGFEVLANTELETSLYDMAVSVDVPGHRWHLSETTGSTVFNDSGVAGFNSLPATISGSPTLGVAPLVQSADNNSLTATTFNGGTDGASATSAGRDPSPGSAVSVDMWFNHGASVNASGEMLFFWGDQYLLAPQMFVYMASNGKIVGGTQNATVTSSISYADSNTHYVAVTENTSGNFSLFIDGALIVQNTDSTVYSATPSNIYGIANGPAALGHANWNGTVQEIATYASTLSATQISNHYSSGIVTTELTSSRIGKVLTYAGIPTSNWSLDTGSTTLMPHSPGTTDAMSYTNLIAESENAGWYVNKSGQYRYRARQSLLTVSTYTASTCTFGDAAGEIPYTDFTPQYDRTDISNDVRITRQGGVTQISRNTASINQYFTRTLQRSGLLMQTDNEALAAAQWLNSNRNQPYWRAQKITVMPQAAPSITWPAVLGIDLEQRVTVRRSPVQTGPTITKQVYVMWINDVIQPGSWVTNYEFAPALDLTDSYLILNDSVKGKLNTGKLAY